MTTTEELKELRDLLAEVYGLFDPPWGGMGKMGPITPATDCACRFTKTDPELHDRLLGIESLSPVQAAELVAIIIANDDAGTGAERPLIGDPAEFPQFVMAHNWRDPVAMESLANYVTAAMEQAQQGRFSDRS